MKKYSSLIVVTLLGLFACCGTSRESGERDEHAKQPGALPGLVVRFATFNVALNRKEAGMLVAEMEQGDNIQIRRVAEVIQRIRPDVILLNEIDYDPEHKSVDLFRENFLSVSQNGQAAIEYPYVHVAPVNTGVESGIDINQDGKIALPDDGYGFGAFPGQYGMALLSRFPIDEKHVRTFQEFRWKDLPNAQYPKKPESENAYYPDDVLEKMRLSSKSHWDIPVQIQAHNVHLICSHPTPPAFDGPEHRNGCRNHDEIRIVADYVSGKADYLYDDDGNKGGLPGGSQFVVVGDLNADPVDGGSINNAALQLTENAAINNSKIPSSKGAVAAAGNSGGKNDEHKGNHAHDTGDFNDDSVGNLRVDYCLPDQSLEIVDCGVFWPAEDETGFELNQASDHHLVWVDIRFD